MAQMVLGVLCGLFVGGLSGLVGIGGGVVLVPLLLYIFSTKMHVAVGTSLSIILLTAVSGSIAHYLRGNVNLQLAIPIAIGAVVGSNGGAWLASLLPGSSLKKIFAVVLLIVAVTVLIDAYNVLPEGGPIPKQGVPR